MAKASLYDEFLTNPKVADLGDPAFRLYVLGIVYVGKELTDGHLERRAMQTLGVWTGRPTKKPAAELEAAGFFDPDGAGGFWIHDYLDHNPSRSEVLASRIRNANRQKAFRERQGTVEDEIVASLDSTGGDGARNALRDDATNAALPNSLPTPGGKDSRSHGFVARSVGHEPGEISHIPGTIEHLAHVVRVTTEDDYAKIRRAARGLAQADLLRAAQQCEGPRVRDRLAVALSALSVARQSKRKTAA